MLAFIKDMCTTLDILSLPVSPVLLKIVSESRVLHRISVNNSSGSGGMRKCHILYWLACPHLSFFQVTGLISGPICLMLTQCQGYLSSTISFGIASRVKSVKE